MRAQSLKSPLLSAGLHVGLLAGIFVGVPAAQRAIREEPIRFEIVAARPVPAPEVSPLAAVTRPLPLVTPSETPPTRKVERPRAFRENAEPESAGEHSPDLSAVAPLTTPLPELSMEATVGVGSATEYTSTTSEVGTLGLKRGAPGGRGGSGLGQGAPGALSGQDGAQLAVSRDWEVSEMPEALNARDFEPDYPALAKKERREAEVVVRLFIDDQGRVHQAIVVEAAGHGFDECALRYVRKLRFRPARAQHRAVAARIEWTVQFRARD